MLKKLKIIISDVGKFFITHFPGAVGNKLRYKFYKKKFKRCGENVVIDQGVIIQGEEDISLGNNVWIDKYCILIAGKISDSSAKVFYKKKNENFDFLEGELIIEDGVHIAPYCILQAHGGISIGKNSGIASGTKIYSLSNHYKNLINKNDKFEFKFTPFDSNLQSLISSPVVIQDDCGIGLSCVIMPGSTIKKGTWVGVSSVVFGEISENLIYSSQPAKYSKVKFQD
jgi:maltose O-acetyltransferase